MRASIWRNAWAAGDAWRPAAADVTPFERRRGDREPSSSTPGTVWAIATATECVPWRGER
jgi:hypothetical protein